MFDSRYNIGNKHIEQGVYNCANNRKVSKTTVSKKLRGTKTLAVVKDSTT